MIGQAADRAGADPLPWTARKPLSQNLNTPPSLREGGVSGLRAGDNPFPSFRFQWNEKARTFYMRSRKYVIFREIVYYDIKEGESLP